VQLLIIPVDGEMAAKYCSRVVDGKEEWLLRTKYKTRNGSIWGFTPHLWSTELDATNDEPLYRYYMDSSRKTHTGISILPKIPTPPNGMEWFKTLKPDANWQCIRNYLESQRNIITPPVTTKRKYLHRKDSIENNKTKYRKRNKNKTEVPVIQEEASIEMVIDTATSNVISSSSVISTSREMSTDAVTSNEISLDIVSSK
jgi:hypothetical protein